MPGKSKKFSRKLSKGNKSNNAAATATRGSPPKLQITEKDFTPQKMISNMSTITTTTLLTLLMNPWQLILAAPANSTTATNYHYGYDNGHRSALLQLYDGLSIQDLIQSSPGNGDGVRNSMETLVDSNENP